MMKKAILCGPKKAPPLDLDLHVVLVRDEHFRTTVVGYFATAEAAKRFADYEHRKKPSWFFHPAKVNTVRDYRKVARAA